MFCRPIMICLELLKLCGIICVILYICSFYFVNSYYSLISGENGGADISMFSGVNISVVLECLVVFVITSISETWVRYPT